MPRKEVDKKVQLEPRREQYLGEHPRQSTSGIRAPRETENAYLVSILICGEVYDRA